MKAEQYIVREVKKIGILRANALGDFIVTLPAIQALKKAYPTAEIVLLGKPWHQSFLREGRSQIDRVVVVPIKKGIRNEHGEQENEDELRAFISEMQNEQFDIMLNFQGNGISANPFIKNFGARITAGFTCDASEDMDRSVEYYYYQNEAVRYMEVARLVGAREIELEPELSVLQTDLQETAGFIQILKQKQFIVLHPVAIDKRRMWPLENYTRLADELKQRQFEVVFTGSNEDRQLVDDIIYNMNYSAINACGKFSLGGLAAVLSKASIVISADTGPLHLARAVGAPTIGFYWAPNLINWGPLTRSLHRPLVSWKLECPICGIVPNDPYPFEPHTENCDHPVSFVRDITIDQVMKNFQELMKTTALEDKTERMDFVKD